MKLSLYIARRYLLSKKNRSSINVITTISIVGIAVCSAAIVIVLSVLNGLTSFIEDMYSAFDADIKVVAEEGRFLPENDSIFQLLSGHEEVVFISKTIEDQVLLEYKNQKFGVLKGVEENFTQVNPVDSKVYKGALAFTDSLSNDLVVLGATLGLNLGTDMSDLQRPITLTYVPSNLPRSVLALQNSIYSTYVFPGGYFIIQKEYDEKYVFGDFHFVQSFFGIEDQLSAYEIKIKDVDEAGRVKQQLEKILPKTYKILTWYEQHETEYKVIKSEKNIIFLILTLMLAITAINITGSLSMIVLEKLPDISVMKSIGGNRELIHSVFLTEGALIGGIGGLIGIGVGFIFCILQQYFGIIKLYGGEIIGITSYPLEIYAWDFVITFFTVLILSLLASLYPARKAAQKVIVEGLKR